MATTSTTSEHRGDYVAHDDASQIRREIEQTRHEMDETLDELGERLTVQHIADSAMDYIKTTSAQTAAQAGAKLRTAAGQVTEKIKEFPMSAAALGVGIGSVSARRMGLNREGLRCAANQATETIRQHPMPAALIGAGLLWWAFERSGRNGGDHARSGRRIQEWRGPYGATYGGLTGRAVPAWHADYDWSQAAEDEDTWTNRARAEIQSISACLSDAGKSAVEKVRAASSTLMGLCGYSNDQVRERMHQQWAGLDERSGSYVDARTAEPYDSSYGKEWGHLGGVQCLAEGADQESESAGWSDKASQLVDDLKQSLGNAGDNVRDTLRTISVKLGEFGTKVGETSSRMSSRVSEGASAAWDRAASGTQRMTQRAKDLGGQAQERIGHGYQVSRDQLVHEIDEHPFAAAGAALGVGLLAGFLMPRTRSEDYWMGEAADHLKDQAREVAERGKEVVQATGQVAMEQVRDQAKDLAQDALDRGKEVAQATTQAALHEAQRHGLSPQQMTQQSGQKTDKPGASQSSGNEPAGATSGAATKHSEGPGAGTACSTQPSTATVVKQSAAQQQPHQKHPR
jgi:ElaB/YqjD/DUF883 family membrane-anchored ribosome-binding protein